MNIPKTFAHRRIRDPLIYNIAQPVVNNPSSKELYPETRGPNPRPSHLPGTDFSHSRLSANLSPLPTFWQMQNDLPVVQQPIPGADQCSEFAKFPLKALFFSRLWKFDDKPENHLAWNHIFQSVMHELNISRSEEPDLLVKYLGPSSTNQAISIRSSNQHNHQKCLQMLWNCLEKRYSNP